MVDYSRYEISPLIDGLGTVSCGPIATKDHSCSILHLHGGGGGSKLTSGRSKILHDRQRS
jgi:hypothetical protein